MAQFLRFVCNDYPRTGGVGISAYQWGESIMNKNCPKKQLLSMEHTLTDQMP